MAPAPLHHRMSCLCLPGSSSLGGLGKSVHLSPPSSFPVSPSFPSPDLVGQEVLVFREVHPGKAMEVGSQVCWVKLGAALGR